jgi:hypothetical protein
MQSLKLVDYSDRELLALVRDLQDREGWTSSTALLNRLGLDHPSPEQCVATRMGWMRRFGAVERHEKGGRYRLTPVGEVMVSGKLNSSTENTLNKIKPEQMLLVTKWLADRQKHSEETARTLIRREWQYGTHRPKQD